MFLKKLKPQCIQFSASIATGFMQWCFYPVSFWEGSRNEWREGWSLFVLHLNAGLRIQQLWNHHSLRANGWEETSWLIAGVAGFKSGNGVRVLLSNGWTLKTLAISLVFTGDSRFPVGYCLEPCRTGFESPQEALDVKEPKAHGSHPPL